MCGIIAYTGTRIASPLLLDGLARLEYRGYDSAGLYTADGLVRSVGKVENLRNAISHATATSGIAHTRWATHGAPEERNAHPHASQNSTLYLVHNGILENYTDIKEALKLKGHTFSSDTDSEVLAHLIGELALTMSRSDALTVALKQVRGTYGIALVYADAPETIYAAAFGSPIAIGVGTGEMWVASDASAVVHETGRIVYLEDGEYAVVTPRAYTIQSLDHEHHLREPQEVRLEPESLEKKGYPHFMLKEIMEIPESVKNTLRGRLALGSVKVKLGGLDSVERELKQAKRLTIVGCGSAYYAGLYGKYLIEELVGMPVDVVLGSEERYRADVQGEKSVLLAISQSGETADTLVAVKAAKQKGTLALGLVNVVGSTIARTTDAGVYTHAGPEIGVASTKAYIAQLVALGLIAIRLGALRKGDAIKIARFAHALADVPTLVRDVLARADDIRAVAEKYTQIQHMLFLGRKYNAATAYEGALKLKEVSYIHAEGYPAGEMKHGPLAMIDAQFPVLAIAPSDSVHEKMISNIQEIRARKGPVIMLATDGDKHAIELAKDVLWLPRTEEQLTPIAAAVTLQLFAYYMGTSLGHDVDKPRNLAKSVTVE